MKGCDFCRYYREIYSDPICCLRDGTHACAACFDELERRWDYEAKSRNIDITATYAQLFDYINSLNAPLTQEQTHAQGREYQQQINDFYNKLAAE